MGAWIETHFSFLIRNIYFVAPYMGAWIETLIVSDSTSKKCVAPYMGAWIETLLNLFCSRIILSHPTWVRGLKLQGRDF